MVLSYPLFFTVYAATLVIGAIASLLLIVGWSNISITKVFASVKYNIIYVAILIALPLLILQTRLEINAENEFYYTNWMFQLSGEAIKVLQDRLNYSVLQDLFIAIYVWVFSFIIYFSPILLLVKDDRATLRRYAIAMTLNYLVLIPFYVFFPVAVSASTPEAGMRPVLYDSLNWGKLVTSVDPLNNDFPSGHVSLMVVTFLVFYLAGIEYRRYYYFLATATTAISFAVLYLGIHWPPDVFAGFVVGVAMAVVSGSPRIQMTIDRYVRMLTGRIMPSSEDHATPPESP